MVKGKTNFSGIWPLVEEFQLREKAKKYGYILQKDASKTEKLTSVIRELSYATSNLRMFLLCMFLAVSGWDKVIAIVGIFGGIPTINTLFRSRGSRA